MVTIASRNVRAPRFSVYQAGRGSEPVMVVGSLRSLVARSMIGDLPLQCASQSAYLPEHRPAACLRPARREAHPPGGRNSPLRTGLGGQIIDTWAQVP